MKTKAAYNKNDPTEKQAVSVQISLLNKGKERAKHITEGNFSRYIQKLIEWDTTTDALTRFVETVAPHRLATLNDSLSWGSSAAITELENEVETHQSEINELAERRSNATEAEYDELLTRLSMVVTKRAWALRKLRATKAPDRKSITNAMVEGMAKYPTLAMAQAEHDLQNKRTGNARDPQFAIRNPRNLRTPQDLVDESRLLPVVVPSGLIEDMKKRIEELEARCRVHAETGESSVV
jgi:hypothetical protein